MKKILFLLLFSIFLSSTFLSSACSNDKAKEDNGEEKPESIFKGKNLATFGNSITAAADSWAYKVQTTLEFGALYNGAVGGAIWSKRERTPGGKVIVTQNFDDPDFAGISNSNAANPDIVEYQKRINNCATVHIQKYLSDQTAPAPDYIIISYGTNDQTATQGSAEETLAVEKLGDVDLFTMAGAVRWCIETLRAEFPEAKLYIALPIQAKSDSKNQGNLGKMEVITKICDALSVPYFDCYKESGITQENESRYLRDGLHPNETGKTMHGSYIANALRDANK